MSDRQKRDIDETTGTELNDHSWDGIRELDTPLPRWWLYIFYASIVIAIIYWVLMPSWPVGNGYLKGVLGFSDRANVSRDVNALREARAPSLARLQTMSYDQVIADPQLAEFARAQGEAIFGDNCRTCHGANGAGAPGYPNLADDVWLWGGSLGDIEHTITVGIRSDHPEARMSQMPAYGRDGLLTAQQIGDVTEYVLTLGPARDREHPNAAMAARGAATFQEQCTVCHMPNGAGDRTQGAPSLVDDVWLYGGSRAEVRRQIELGRGGVMPTWAARFSPAEIRALSVYVYSLGGGEADAPVAPAAVPASTEAAPAAAEAAQTP